MYWEDLNHDHFQFGSDVIEPRSVQTGAGVYGTEPGFNACAFGANHSVRTDNLPPTCNCRVLFHCCLPPENAASFLLPHCIKLCLHGVTSRRVLYRGPRLHRFRLLCCKARFLFDLFNKSICGQSWQTLHFLPLQIFGFGILFTFKKKSSPDAGFSSSNVPTRHKINKKIFLLLLFFFLAS